MEMESYKYVVIGGGLAGGRTSDGIRSEHTIARGVRKAAEERGLSPMNVTDFEILKGRGVRARYNGLSVSNLVSDLGILDVSEDPIVSSDIIGDSHASLVDLAVTRVVDGDLVKVMSWYDNEWGFTSQMVREAAKLASKVGLDG